MIRKYKLAVCQMDSINDKQANLAKAAELLREAHEGGALLAVLPETMNFMGRGLRKQAETIPGPTTDFLASKAREYHMWIITGSFPEICEQGKPGNTLVRTNPQGKPKNTLVLIDPEGEIRCKYSKIHMFDVNVDEVGGYKESNSQSAGDQIVLCDTEMGRLGFAICYDLRFPELFRLLALNGAQLVIMPSSFASTTGAAHWMPLIQARTIENGFYLAAADQCGEKVNMTAYGHSVIVDPWGTVLAEKDEGEGVIFADIDLDHEEEIRRRMPSLKNRREDVYTLQ